MQQVVSSGRTAMSVVVVTLVVAIYLFANSVFFETDHVEWTGLVYVDPEQLDAFLDFSPMSVWRLNTRELESFLRRHPWVKEVKTTWRWPNRVIVSISERQPLAQVPSAAGWFLLDDEGHLLPTTQVGVVYSLPVITNLDLSSIEMLKATARLITLVPADLRAIISEWNASTRSFITRSGTEIMMGAPEDLQEKFVLLERILDDLARRNEQAGKIDLRVTKNPVVSIL